MSNNFWSGPFGVLVSNDIHSVVAKDEGNIIYKNGGCTEMYCGPKLSEQEYKNKYCEYNFKDSLWYYKYQKNINKYINLFAFII